jgi:peptidyl-prolyl cis-trans isomerase D
MLKYLSRMERTRNLIIVLFAVMLAVSLIVFYAPGRSSSMASAPDLEPVAEIGDQQITAADVTETKEAYQQMFGGQFNPAMFGGTKGILNTLIRQRVVQEEAERVGLAASDAEVADYIRKTFRDPATGKFVGIQKYRENVESRQGGVERYENQIRQQIAAQKLEAYVTAGVRVSEDEVRDTFKRQNTSFDLSYAVVNAEKLAEKINPSDEELRSYYDKHKTDYRIFEPQKKIRYIYIDQAKVGEKLNIPEQDLKAEYDKLAADKKVAGVKVQQIVLKVAREDLEDTVRQKADEIVKKLRGDKTEVTEEAFAEAARGNSEDTATAKNGGRLAALVKKNPNEADDTEEPIQRTIDMKPGEITDPILDNKAFYIYRRGDSVPKTFEDAKKELLVSLRTRRAYSVAADIAARATKRLKEVKDVQKVAAEFASEANMTPANMVKETPYVKPGDDVPEIGSSPQFEEAINPLKNNGDIGDRVAVKGGFAVPLLADKKDPRIPEFEEVKDKVVKVVKEEKAKEQLEKIAREIASTAKSPAEIKALAEKYGLKAESTTAYKLTSPLGEAGTSPLLDETILKLQAGEVAKNPVKVSDHWVIVGATKRTDADLTEFAKQRDQLMQTALSTKKSQVFEDYIAAVQNRMRKDGEIKIYDEVVARLDEVPTLAPPQ